MAATLLTQSAARASTPTVSARPGDPVPAITPSPAAWPIQARNGSHHTRYRIATPESAREELRHFAALDDAVQAVAARIAVLGLATTTITAIGAGMIIARALMAALPRML